jgi:hypothetical protein
MKQKSFCIVCGLEKDGIEVKEDGVLRTMRYIKRNLLRSAKNNRIVVCKQCYEAYKKYRKRYVSRQHLYLGLGIVFLVLTLLLNVSIASVLFGLGVLVLLYLLSLVNYMPDINVHPSKVKK